MLLTLTVYLLNCLAETVLLFAHSIVLLRQCYCFIHSVVLLRQLVLLFIHSVVLLRLLVLLFIHSVVLLRQCYCSFTLLSC